MPAEYAAKSKIARTELTRRPIDCTLLSVQCIGTTVHITGVIRPLRGHGNVDLRAEMDKVTQALRSKLGVHEVVWDVTFRT